jgi:hypothetical protein
MRPSEPLITSPHSPLHLRGIRARGFPLQRAVVIADVDCVIVEARRAAHPAGGSAGRRFETLARAWRRRVLRPVLLACSALVIAFSVAGALVNGQAKFWFGVLAGATVAVYLAVRDSPPAHIENWRLGSQGERRTARRSDLLHGESGGSGTTGIQALAQSALLGPAFLKLESRVARTSSNPSRQRL